MGVSRGTTDERLRKHMSVISTILLGRDAGNTVRITALSISMIVGALAGAFTSQAFAEEPSISPPSSLQQPTTSTTPPFSPPRGTQATEFGAESLGADFVPITLRGLVPVRPGTLVAVEAVFTSEMTEPLWCGFTVTNPIRFAESERSLFVLLGPPECAAHTAQLIVRNKGEAIAAFPGHVAVEADLSTLAMNPSAARVTYGWISGERAHGRSNWPMLFAVALLSLCVVRLLRDMPIGLRRATSFMFDARNRVV